MAEERLRPSSRGAGEEHFHVREAVKRGPFVKCRQSAGASASSRPPSVRKPERALDLANSSTSDVAPAVAGAALALAGCSGGETPPVPARAPLAARLAQLCDATRSRGRAPRRAPRQGCRGVPAVGSARPRFVSDLRRLRGHDPAATRAAHAAGRLLRRLLRQSSARLRPVQSGKVDSHQADARASVRTARERRGAREPAWVPPSARFGRSRASDGSSRYRFPLNVPMRVGRFSRS